MLVALALGTGLGLLFSGSNRQPAIGEKAVLADGRELTLCAVTFGCEHTAVCGRPVARFLARLPDKWVYRWRRIAALPTGTETGRAVFTASHLGLWFVRPGSSIAIADPGFLRWKITSGNGAEHGGAIGSVGSSSMASLFSVFIDSYPRRLSQFTVQLVQSIEGKRGEPETKVVGRFLIRNPSRSRAPLWTAEPLPVHRKGVGVACTVFSVVPNDGHGTTNRVLPLPVKRYCSTTYHFGGHGGGASVTSPPYAFRDDARCALATFEFSGTDAVGAQWEVQQFRLTDPAGNTSFADSIEWQTTEKGHHILTCRTIPLWPDDPAWRIQLDLVRLEAGTNRGFQRRLDFFVKSGWSKAGIATVRLAVPNPTQNYE